MDTYTYSETQQAPPPPDTLHKAHPSEQHFLHQCAQKQHSWRSDLAMPWPKSSLFLQTQYFPPPMSGKCFNSHLPFHYTQFLISSVQGNKPCIYRISIVPTYHTRQTLNRCPKDRKQQQNTKYSGEWIQVFYLNRMVTLNAVPRIRLLLGFINIFSKFLCWLVSNLVLVWGWFPFPPLFPSFLLFFAIFSVYENRAQSRSQDIGMSSL